MEITIKGTPEEIKKALQAIGSSKEQESSITIDSKKINKIIQRATHDISANSEE